MAHRITVVWTGNDTIWGTDCKIGPFRSADVTWDLYQRRRGLVRRLLPLPVFLSDVLPGNVAMVGNKVGMPGASLEEIVELYETRALHDAKDEPVAEPQKVDLSDYTNEELRDLCRDRDLPVYGAKAELIERLEGSD